MRAAVSHWWQVTIGLGNGLVPLSNIHSPCMFLCFDNDQFNPYIHRFKKETLIAIRAMHIENKMKKDEEKSHIFIKSHTHCYQNWRTDTRSGKRNISIYWGHTIHCLWLYHANTSLKISKMSWDRSGYGLSQSQMALHCNISHWLSSRQECSLMSQKFLKFNALGLQQVSFNHCNKTKWRQFCPVK